MPCDARTWGKFPIACKNYPTCEWNTKCSRVTRSTLLPSFGNSRPQMLRTILVVSVLLVASPSAYSQSLVSIYQQNFNSGGGGWTSASTPIVPSNNQPWATGPTGVGGTGAWTTSGIDDGGSPFFQTLTSPVINVPYTANTRFSFDHSYNFEFDGTVWDGGVVMVSVNGSPFTQIPDSAFTRTATTRSFKTHFHGSLLTHSTERMCLVVPRRDLSVRSLTSARSVQEIRFNCSSAAVSTGWHRTSPRGPSTTSYYSR